MFERTVSGITLTLLLIGMLTLAFNIQSVKAEPKTWTVDDDGPADYHTIQAAVNKADEGDMIYVRTGVYCEKVVVNKTLSLVGENKLNTIIDANNAENIIKVTSNNVTIKNFSIRNSGYLNAGVYLVSVQGCNILNNYITNTSFGIWLESSLSNTLCGNVVTNNDRKGVVLEYSSYNILSENNVTNNHFGVELRKSLNNSIYGNYVANHFDFSFWFFLSSGNEVHRNRVINSEVGFWVYRSSDNTIYRNILEKNYAFGVRIDHSSNNVLSRNNLMKNNEGIRLCFSHNNDIYANNITDGRARGFWLEKSSNNMIHHNNFINNSAQVYTRGSSYCNIWNDSYPSGGNYWSDYTGVDLYTGPSQDLLGSDGIGDTPYVIDENNTDRYPLAHPWSSLPVHNINTGLAYTTIQEAINASETLDGHTIFVEAGTYYENVVVNKAVFLIGQNREAIIDGKRTGNVVSITVYNVTLSCFTIQNSGTEYNSGIYFFNASATLGNVTISSNNIINNYFGIHVFSSFNILLVANNIANNEVGVNLEQSFSTAIISNNMARNTEGILLYCSDYNTLSGNNLKDNDYGVYVHCSLDNKIYNNNFINNMNQVYIDGYINIWNDSYPSGGNYWSDHVCTGNPSDGSQPYIIDENNVDHYPFQDPNGWINTLTIYSLPTGVTFTVDGVSRTTPWSGTYTDGTSISLIMPEIHTARNAKFYWNQWSDGNTSQSRTVTMDTDITLTAYYTGPYYQLTVTSLPITGITFTIDGVLRTTSYTEWLLLGSYTLEMPETHNGYVWSHWLEEGDPNRTKTITLPCTTWTGVFVFAVQPHGPEAEFTATPDTALAGESIKFDASASWPHALPGWNGTHTMPITEYRWDFADGNQTTTSTPIVYHSFSSLGIYYVALTVYAPGATPETDSTTKKVTITAIPVGGYSFPIKGYTAEKPLTLYLVLIAILAASFTMIRRKTHKRAKRP